MSPVFSPTPSDSLIAVEIADSAFIFTTFFSGLLDVDAGVTSAIFRLPALVSVDATFLIRADMESLLDDEELFESAEANDDDEALVDLLLKRLAKLLRGEGSDPESEPESSESDDSELSRVLRRRLGQILLRCGVGEDGTV